MVAIWGNQRILGPQGTGNRCDDRPECDGVAGVDSDLVRGLVHTLDGCGYHNLAFAISKCATDKPQSEQAEVEQREFVELAKKLLKNFEQK